MFRNIVWFISTDLLTFGGRTSGIYHIDEARQNIPQTVKAMLQSVEGIYRNGKVELQETPEGMDGTRVIVTFLSTHNSVDLPSRGINQEQAADLRHRLASFAEDWERPDMAAYDAL
jgi:hypothetical protein